MNSREIKKILLAHGGGGRLSDELIRNTILKKLGQSSDSNLYDSANLTLDSKDICFTTDNFVVKPLFFKAGDIGRLAVCGTVNDLAVSGARTVAMSLSFIIEEGLEFETFEKILESIKKTSDENNVKIVTGDTKTVEMGSADKIFINTAGIGIRIKGADLGFEKINAGDRIIINGTIGDHGMAIISQRQGISFEGELESDCAGLWGIINNLLEKPNGVKFMRDPTRGGLAASLNEICTQTGLNIEIRQNDIPVKPVVAAAADMLGFDILNIANEGKFIAIVSAGNANEYLKIIRQHPLGKDAAIIGEIKESTDAPVVEMITSFGGKRIVAIPYGRELPRIC